MSTPNTHSKKYSPSKSSTWLVCPLSTMFNDGSNNETNEASEFGSECHLLGETLIRKSLNIKDFEEELVEPSELIKTFVHYDEEMEDLANQYANFVIANVSIEEKKGNKPFVILEQQLEMDFDSDAKGTLDCGIISNGTLTVIDLKTGRLKVEAYNQERGIFNTQLGIYALYAYKTFKDLFPIERVKLVIFQPRLNSVSDYEMELQELLDFETNILIPAVAKTKEAVLEAHVNSGCQYCAGKAICAERNKALEKVDSKKPIQTLSDEEINKILPFLDEIISYCESLKEFALKKALNGFKWEGLKLVHDNA